MSYLPDNARDESKTVHAPDIHETVRHEENLINMRLTWPLTFQGFLFAAVS